MSGFGEWLNESKLGLTDIIILREKTRTLAGWENIVKSDKIGEYVTRLQTIPCLSDRNSAIDALYKLWSLYETEENQAKSKVSATGWIAAIVAALMIGLIFWVLYSTELKQIGADNTRGVLAFLFGLTTVGVIIIVVVAVFFESGEPTMDARFQRGKDILTILIGLLGAILGYYFGQASSKNLAPSPTITAESPQTPTKDSGSGTVSRSNKDRSLEPCCA